MEPRYSIKNKTRRYYPAGEQIMTVVQDFDTIQKAKRAAWCHKQVCPSHVTHIRKLRNGRYSVVTKMFPKTLAQVKMILQFGLCVARRIALKHDCQDEATHIEDIGKRLRIQVF